MPVGRWRQFAEVRPKWSSSHYFIPLVRLPLICCSRSLSEMERLGLSIDWLCGEPSPDGGKEVQQTTQLVSSFNDRVCVWLYCRLSEAIKLFSPHNLTVYVSLLISKGPWPTLVPKPGPNEHLSGHFSLISVSIVSAPWWTTLITPVTSTRKSVKS